MQIQSLFRITLTALLACMGYAEASGAKSNEDALHLIPTPQQVDQQTGQYRFSPESTIILESDDLLDRFAADQLALKLRESMGIKIEIGVAPKIESIQIGFFWPRAMLQVFFTGSKHSNNSSGHTPPATQYPDAKSSTGPPSKCAAGSTTSPAAPSRRSTF